MTVLSDLSWLTEQLITNRALASAFSSGYELYESGALGNPLAFPWELRATLDGPPWGQVRIAFGPQGLERTWCTIHGDQFCEHVVALGLTGVHRPESFEQPPDPHGLLAGLAKEELLSLIDTMLQREPSLGSLVQLAAPSTRKSAGEAVFRRMAARALRHDDPARVSLELGDLIRLAHEMADQRHWERAGSVYQAVLAELADGYGRRLLGRDEDWGIKTAAADCIEGLEYCLTEGRPRGERNRQWLDTVLTAALTDVTTGGVEFAYGAIDTVLDHASPGEWPALEQRIRAALAGAVGRHRETLVDWLVAWRQRNGRPAEADDVVRELGTEQQRLVLMAREGRVATAVDRARREFADRPATITRLADALVQSGAAAEAVALVAGLAGGAEVRPAYLEWLAWHYRQQGETASALHWYRELFLRQPEVRKYFVLRRVAGEMGVWPEVRTEILDRLEAEGKTDRLLEIAVVENDNERILALFDRLTPERAAAFRPIVAGAVAKTHPRRAFYLYRAMVAEAMATGDPAAWREAAGHLAEIKKLPADARPEGEEYLAALKAEYGHLPAFRYELARAGL